ncbi:ABC transporter permease [Labrys wisconsinensis]|uniref:Ribose/xylose/arabinose/galactoside ABC-type transport system permease subunit n=1 Tax=Labrys wisconsinensis TaxID=425677 RepID=A0ABU0JAU0_9HYPH|nr:ABC transporter permease [Labrys wisconsinensis]MDQ0470656.1 ribose/xylose/arabinose/galactoside ABC-type transport system permease subunit [Labrys wisconsinensis]
MRTRFLRALGTQRALNSLRTLGLFLAILVIAAIVQSQRAAFLSFENLLTLLRSMVALGMVAFAQKLVILLGEIDLSVGAVYGLSAIVTATLWLGGGSLPFTTPLIPALLAAVAIAVLVGLLNGFFTVRAGLPSFIATLGMLNVAESLQLLVSNASTFTPAYNDPLPPEWELSLFHNLGGALLPFGIPVETLWLAAAFVLFWVLRHRTVFGFRLVAIGGNPDAARIARLPVKKYKYIVFVLSSLIAAIAGIIDFSYVGSVGPSQSGSLLFSVIAAVVIGGASLNGGRGTILGTLLGAVLLALLNNGLALLGVGSFAQLLFIGLVTIGAVWLDIASQKLIRHAGQRSAERAA